MDHHYYLHRVHNRYQHQYHEIFNSLLPLLSRVFCDRSPFRQHGLLSAHHVFVLRDCLFHGVVLQYGIDLLFLLHCWQTSADFTLLISLQVAQLCIADVHFHRYFSPPAF